MFKNPLAKILRLDEPTLEVFSFCEMSRGKAFIQWLNSLPHMDPSGLIEKLYTAISELAEVKLSPTLRFAHLEAILPKIAECKPVLERTYLRRTVDASKAEQRALEMAQAMDGFILVAYARVLVGGLSKKQDMAIVISRLLETVFEISVRCSKLYFEVPRRIWPYLYQIHEFADKKGLLNQEVDLVFRDLTAVTPHNLFLQSILLSCAGTMQLQANQVTELVSVLPKMANSVGWGLLKQFPDALFMVNVLDYRPPVYMDEQQRSSRYIKAVQLSQLMSELTQEIDNPYAEQLSDELKTHLERLWLMKPVRQGQRRQSNSKVKLLRGIYKAFGLLTGGQTPAQFICANFPKEWLEEQYSDELDDKNEIKMYGGELQDISDGEIGAKVTVQGFPPGLCSGDLITLNSDDGLRFGLVRWLRVASRSACQAGLEFVSLDLQPCVIQYLNTSGEWGRPLAALMSLIEVDGEPRLKLILRRGSFENTQAIRMFASKRIVYVQVVGKEHITGSVIIATFGQIDPAQLPLENQTKSK